MGSDFAEEKNISKATRMHVIVMTLSSMIFIEFDKINDAVCLSNQRSCPSGIWPGPGKKGKEKGTGGAN